jgi:glycosyltransferase involved in cell wall biosynthesis
MDTAFIVDPALYHYAGHHFTSVVGWTVAAQRRGFHVRILSHKGFLGDSVLNTPLERVFMGRFYDVAPPDERDPWKRLRKLQREFKNSLAAPLMRVQPTDIIILSHPTLVTMNGLAAWASGMPRQHLPRLVTWHHHEPQKDDFVTPFQSTNCLTAAVDRLKTLFGDRWTLTATRRDISKEWQGLFSLPVHILPYIALRPEICTSNDRTASSPPTVLFTGHLGIRKGLHLMAGIIEAIERRGLQVQWVIAGSSFEPGSAGLSDIFRLADAQSNVSVVLDPHGVADYDKYISSAHLAVLPYSPELYSKCTSGVAEEAEWLGLPYVAPKAAFSADAESAGAAVCFEEWTVEGIATALADAVSRLPQISGRASKRALHIQQQLRVTQEQILSLTFGERATTTVVPIAPLPGVDIIVTLHNYRRFLRPCLESVSRQTYPNWRCIVIDDCSTDITFDELRAVVSVFGDKFTCERHSTRGGQIKAISTGLSLGSNPFVLMLDVDDYLTDDALDSHLSWHLNSFMPASLTSGRMQIVDEFGRVLAGCLDNLRLEHAGFITNLPLLAAYRRVDSDYVPGAAYFMMQGSLERWFWSPASGIMFRRSMIELVLPDDIEIGMLGADTFFAFASHALGGSILIDKHVGCYRRHGSNGRSDTGVYGAATMADRSCSSNWREVAINLRSHIESNYNYFVHEIRAEVIGNFLKETAWVVEGDSSSNTQTRSAPVGTSPESVEATAPICVERESIRQFARWMAQRRVLVGLTRRLLLGRRTEVRSILSQSLRAHGIPDVVATPVIERLSALRLVLGLARRRAVKDLNTIQELVAAQITQTSSKSATAV